MKLTFKAKAAIFGCILGFLPIAKLWIQYPVALTSEAKNAEVNNIDIKKKNELFDIGVGTASKDCYYLKVFFKIQPNGPVLPGVNEIEICDQFEAMEKSKFLKSKMVNGYLTKNKDHFIPTGLLSLEKISESLIMAIGLFLFCYVIGYSSEKNK